jgi:hypothetical protein
VQQNQVGLRRQIHDVQHHAGRIVRMMDMSLRPLPGLRCGCLLRIGGLPEPF